MARRRNYRRNPSTTTWLLLGGVVVGGGVAYYLYSKSKGGAGSGGTTPAKPVAPVPPPGVLTAQYVIGKDGLSTIPPGGTTASVPVNSPCAAVQATVKAAKAAGDIPAFSKGVAQWNAQCPKFTLGV
jgi:hypothetical protein